MTSTRPTSDRDIVPNRAAGYEIDNRQLKQQSPATVSSGLPTLEDKSPFVDAVIPKGIPCITSWTS
jgi:hypothetical protein